MDDNKTSRSEFRHCVACGDTFIPKRHDQKFCSRTCHDRWNATMKRTRRQDQGLCPQCGKPVGELPMRIGSGKKKGKAKITYCAECRARYAARYRASREAKEEA